MGITAIKVTGDSFTAAPNELNPSVTKIASGAHQEGRVLCSIDVPYDFRDAVTACHNHLGKRGLAGTPRADDGNKTRIQGNLAGANPISTLHSQRRDNLRRYCRRRWFGSHVHSLRWIYTSLAQRIELYPTLHPREAVSCWLSNLCFRMGIGAVQARLEPSIAGS